MPKFCLHKDCTNGTVATVVISYRNVTVPMCSAHGAEAMEPDDQGRSPFSLTPIEAA